MGTETGRSGMGGSGSEYLWIGTSGEYSPKDSILRGSLAILRSFFCRKVLHSSSRLRCVSEELTDSMRSEVEGTDAPSWRLAIE